MVVVFDNLISGHDAEFLNTFKKFIDYATLKNATFVTTMDLVNMSIAENPAPTPSSSRRQTYRT